MAQIVEVPNIGQVEFPDGMSDADIGAAIRKTLGQKKPEPTLPEKIAGSAPVRFAIGAAEPILGGAQMVANMLPGNAGKTVNEHLTQLDQMINAGRGNSDFDPARFAGNILSPVNAGVAKAMPAAATTLGRAGVGAASGAVGGATSTVTGPGEYWQQKGAQAGLGAVTGGVLAPVAGKVLDAALPRLEAIAAKYSAGRSAELQFRAVAEADAAIEKALKEVGARADDLGAEQMKQLRKTALDSLKAGKQKDLGAALRQSDFQSAGVEPTLGQITRDSTQFAREKNLRGVAGVGEPLQNRFDTQNQQLQSAIGNLRGNPSEPYQAGRVISGALGEVDSKLKKGVDAAYSSARDSVGRAAPVSSQEFSTKANLALDEGMLGHYLPSEVRSIMNDVSAGKIPLNVQTMVQIDSTLSSAQRAAGKGTPQALAIGKVRDALNQAPIENQAGEMAKQSFDAARKMASERFGLHKAIPALEAAASGEAPDRFVQNYVINGKVDEVKKLAELLKKSNPEAFQEARSQIGDKITRAAFGENTAGDKIASPERLAKALRDIGTDKLSAFYSAEEIKQLKTLSRVAAYINSTPSSAPVNTSNNIGAITGLATKLPGIPAALSIANALRNTASTASTVNKGVAAQVPEQTAKLTAEQSRALARLLSGGAVASGMAGAASVR